MRKTVVTAIAAALILSPTSASAASDPDLCNWVPKTNDIQAGVRTRLVDGTLIWLGPGFCTDPGDEVLRLALQEGLSYQVKWRDPRTGYSGTKWIDGYRLIEPEKNGLKYRILDIEVNEKTER
jgi:hypothetical protein